MITRILFKSPASTLRLAMAVSACAAFVIVLGLVAYQSLVNLASSAEFAAEAERGRSQLASVLEDLAQMGNGVRPFLASGDQGAFADAEEAAARLETDIHALDELSHDPVQQSLSGPLRDLAAQRSAQTRHLFEVALRGNRAETEALIKDGQGAHLMTASRALIARMQARQGERLEERERSVAQARLVAESAVGITTILAASMIFLVVWLTARHAMRLRSSQEELATTLRSIGDAVISTDANGNVRFMNNVAQVLTGWEAQAARGMPLEQVFDICNEMNREPVQNPVRQVISAGLPVSLANHTVLMARDGTERPIEDSGAPIRDANGNIVGVVLVFRDASTDRAVKRALFESEAQLREANATLEQKVAERAAALEAQETLIRTFFENSSESHAVLAEHDDGFRYEELNPATLQLLGKTREELIGQTLQSVFASAPAAELTANLKTALRVNTPFRFEQIHGEATLEAIATQVPVAGSQRKLVVSARDVTERRALELQLLQSRKMEAVGQLTGGLAHDFNNLLSGISGSFELLHTRLTQGRTADLHRFIDSGQAAARRAAALTHRLLAFSRRQTLDAKPTDVNRLIGDMVELVSRTVGPEISVEVVGGIGLWHPLVDGHQVENALLNLCINARDAMPGGGKITIETANRWIDERTGKRHELSPGQYISICVSDTGCGMTPEVIARAFEPFFTTKPLGQGTGLGLSMIYGFARQSGGQVRIYSEVGGGAMICLYLPRAPEAAGAAALAAPEETASIVKSPGKTVLVVDDEAVVRMLVLEALQDLGCSAVECEDGVMALEILESSLPIDLLITDVGLPKGINGRQLADAARKLRPALKVLFITGYAENAVFSHGHVESGLEVLTKPFLIEDLSRRVIGLIAARAPTSRTS